MLISEICLHLNSWSEPSSRFSMSLLMAAKWVNAGIAFNCPEIAGARDVVSLYWIVTVRRITSNLVLVRVLAIWVSTGVIYSTAHRRRFNCSSERFQCVRFESAMPHPLLTPRQLSIPNQVLSETGARRRLYPHTHFPSRRPAQCLELALRP